MFRYPRSVAQKPVLLGLAAALVLGASVYGYNVYRNLDAAERAHVACAHSDDHVESILTSTREWLELLSEDANHVEDLMRSAIERPCSVVKEELVWWRWGWGRQLTIDLDPEGEMGRAGRELAARCPDVMGPVVRETFLGDDADRVISEVCGSLDSALLPAGDSEQTMSLWDWPSELEAREEMLRPPEAE